MIRACVPVELHDRLAESAARGALDEGLHNYPPLPVVSALAGVPMMLGMMTASAIHLVGKTWAPGRVIVVGFLGGSAAQRAKVRRLVSGWTAAANVGFAFGDGPAGEIRVDFRPGGSWSTIGTDALAVAEGPTLNLGWVTDTSDDVSDRAVILHEFGHALGLGHEQSHPDETIAWKHPEADRYYAATQGWSPDMVRANVFAVFARDQVEGTGYDRSSIMQYPVPAELTRDGRGIGWNTDLSDLDREHIAAMYPGRMPAPVAPVVPPPTWSPAPGAIPLRVGFAPASARANAGEAARFGLFVARPSLVTLAVGVDRAFGAAPRVIGRSGGDPYPIVLRGGRGSRHYEPGAHEVDVYHPLSGVPFTARMSVARS